MFLKFAVILATKSQQLGFFFVKNFKNEYLSKNFFIFPTN